MNSLSPGCKRRAFSCRSPECDFMMDTATVATTTGRRTGLFCELSFIHLFETLICFSHSLSVSDGGGSQATLARHQSSQALQPTQSGGSEESKPMCTYKAGITMATTLRGGTVSPITKTRLHKNFTVIFLIITFQLRLRFFFVKE